jgi:hypothetical protein
MDVVLDNAGLELYTDLLMADFLVSSGLASKVALHGKLLPWFVSDTLAGDLEGVLAALEGEAPAAGMEVGRRARGRGRRGGLGRVSWGECNRGRPPDLGAARLARRCRARVRRPPRRSGAPCGGWRSAGADTSRQGAGSTRTTRSGRRPSPTGGWRRWAGGGLTGWVWGVGLRGERTEGTGSMEG